MSYASKQRKLRKKKRINGKLHTKERRSHWVEEDGFREHTRSYQRTNRGLKCK